jgi:hypothetical protein
MSFKPPSSLPSGPFAGAAALTALIAGTVEMEVDSESPIPSMAPPQHQLQDETGPSNSPECYPSQVFMGTPISQPNPPGPSTTQIQNLDGTVTTLMLASDTLASRAGTLPPHKPSPGKKLPKKVPLPENSDLSVFDILNTFHCHWFLSVDSLRAQALLA